MAYSDYGGFAYRNGTRVEDRSDAVIKPDMVNVGEAGVYPGFAAINAGQSLADFEATRDMSVSGHVVLGDGPVLLEMYKQTSAMAYRLADGQFTAAPEMSDLSGWQLAEDDAGPVSFVVDGHTIELLFEQSDNYYQYARLTQPDGTVWTGFSGYGVGEGLEDCGYGFDTGDCVSRLHGVFPAIGTSAGTAETPGAAQGASPQARAEGIAHPSPEQSS